MTRRCLFSLLLLVSLLSGASSRADSAPSYLDELRLRARELSLWDDRYWHVLMHYRRLLSGVKSEVDSKAYFNAPDGATHPREELEATLARFFEPAAVPSDPERQHPQCQFIDRFEWLRDKLAIDPARLPPQPCPQYHAWRAALDPGGVTLVFSSYYLNNPSSAFGHTLLRLNHKSRHGTAPLLDYGVNYAANPTTRNAFLYTILGLTGGFSGTFSNIPYYLKVQEYNDVESRDLWEYDLRFTPPEIERLMRHLWAVGRIPISYYFLDKNCSFMVLTLLDAANPALRLAEQFDSFWVIPSETLRAVAERPGLVSGVTIRPSVFNKIQRARARLAQHEDAVFRKMLDSHDLSGLTPLDAPSRARLLDLTLEYLKLRKLKSAGKLADPEARFQDAVLAARSELSAPVEAYPYSQDELAGQRPDQGHKAARVAIAPGYNRLNGPYLEAGYRPAFHDLNASSRGFPRTAQIEFLDVALRYSPRPQRLSLERANLLKIVSLAPLDLLFPKVSWTVSLGAEPARDVDCGDCIEYRAAVGGGLALRPARALHLYALALAELGAGADTTPPYRLGPAAEAGALLDIGDHLGLLASSSYHLPLLGFTQGYARASAQLRWSPSTNLDLRLVFEQYPVSSDVKLALNLYY